MNETIGIIPRAFRRRGVWVACTLLLRAGLNFLGLAAGETELREGVAFPLHFALPAVVRVPDAHFVVGRKHTLFFDAGEGKAFEDGKLTLEDLRTIALRDGEPKQISGKQELYEMIVNLHI